MISNVIDVLGDEMGLCSIEDVIKDASKGKIFILVDDENRENEGDLCVLGEFASPDAINS